MKEVPGCQLCPLMAMLQNLNLSEAQMHRYDAWFAVIHPPEVGPRRPGDSAVSTLDPTGQRAVPRRASKPSIDKSATVLQNDARPAARAAARRGAPHRPHDICCGCGGGPRGGSLGPPQLRQPHVAREPARCAVSESCATLL